ncbi:uncharacterized protein LOC133531015 isoform X2 [Cydia pomonella]|uniref:uncharacterized protein LOC133531015 isoform X2 n=1 Tax=Cydia pomonella TaxID=82600 RepID=UPI002ADDF5B8|nr:uncharacterized protein LOC133531015 isoform X2 [Cydia pomonella]
MDEGLVDNCCYCISLRTGCIIIAWLAASALIVGVGYHYFGDFDMFEDFWWVFLIIYFPALFEVINSIVFLCCLNAYEEFAKFYFMEACVVKLAMDLALAMFFIVLGCGDPDEPWTLQAINYYAMGIAVFYTYFNIYFLIVAHSYRSKRYSENSSSSFSSRISSSRSSASRSSASRSSANRSDTVAK